MELELMRYDTNETRGKTAVVQRGNKWLHVMVMDGVLSVCKVPLTEERYMRPLMIGDRPYPRSRLRRVFARYGKQHGATKAAKAMLRSL